VVDLAPDLLSVAMRRPEDDTPREPRLDYHDPTAGIGGSSPAASALTLRMWLAGAALAACVMGIVLTVAVSGPVTLIAVLIVVALTTLVDLSVIATRRRRENAG
jgi:hypothetical protein